MLELFERDLPLNVITEKFDRKRWLKLSITAIALLVFMLLLFVNYSFPSLQNIYGLNGSTNFAYVGQLEVNRSLVANELKNRSSDDAVGFEKTTVIPTRFNRLINSTTQAPSTLSKTQEILLDYCNLTNINPWDPTIMKFHQPQKDYMLNCTPQIFQHSKLIDGQLFIYSKNTSMEMNCQMRCLLPNNDHSIEFGDWIKVRNGTKPECDIVEVECRLTEDNGTKVAPFYKYLHAHVYRNSSRLPPSSISKPPEKYDVHVIVFDSVSHTQFIRSMPKTLHILRDHYDVIPFYHLNKIGLNSYYNGFAFLIGKMVNDIFKSPFSRGHVADYSDKSKICHKSIDDEQFIGFRYQDDGYVTMMAEDWANGLFNWPNCVGFLKTPVDHYMRPFQLRTEKVDDKPKDIAKTIFQNSCRHHYNVIITDYLKNFLEAYPDKPKFSITWMIDLAHNYQNALSSSDDFFYRFFSDTKKDFENSFLFIMGDHGLRFGKIRETKVGEMEDNNPAFFLSVPKPLRDNATLMNQLRKNSKELVTHYDIYATLNEIAQPKNPRIPNPILHGSSLFHPLPYPRTCDSLRIPFEYCNCRVKRTLLPKNNKIGIPATKLMVEQMNLNLSASNETSTFCADLSLNETTEIIVEDYGGEQALRVYQITFSTLPGNGRFTGTVSYDSSNQKFKILSSKFERLNAYGAQAKCASKSLLASYCYCLS